MPTYCKIESAGKIPKTPAAQLAACHRNYYLRGGKERLADYYSNRLTPEQRQNRYAKARDWKRRNADRMRIHRLAGNLKTRVLKKGAAAFDIWKLIGCDCAQLAAYLDAQCAAGTDWRDGRRFHIDHIRPLHQFDLRDPLQLRECLHFGNLQVLPVGSHEAKSAAEIDHRAFMEALALQHWQETKGTDYPGFRIAWAAFTCRLKTAAPRSAPLDHEDNASLASKER